MVERSEVKMSIRPSTPFSMSVERLIGLVMFVALAGYGVGAAHVRITAHEDSYAHHGIEQDFKRMLKAQTEAAEQLRHLASLSKENRQDIKELLKEAKR